ncbi:MAG TPA: glycosyltransferase family 2 protein [Clostridia bacterium]|nr:glycosyltransferase family 2 protein [Clostridia bacterium]
MTQGKKWSNEMVSVIMPAYNSEGTISSAIDSVIAQTYTDWELLIYDDCSNDGTCNIAAGYSGRDKRITVVRGDRNAGVASARNKALEMAAGRFISFLDSDDLWKADKLRKQVDFMHETGCSLCYTSYELMNSSGTGTGRIVKSVYKEADYKSLLRNNYIGTLTVLIDRNCIDEINFTSNRHEDYLMWLDFVKKGYSLMGLDESLAYYRVSRGSLSGNKMRAAAWRWNVYRNCEGITFGRSLLYMAIYTFNSIAKRI